MIDSTSLASLTAGSIAATGGLAKIIGEDDFPTHFHQGVRDNLHITTGRQAHDPGGDLRRAQLARSRPAAREEGRRQSSTAIFEEVRKRSPSRRRGIAGSPFAEITDDDIDNLFSD